MEGGREGKTGKNFGQTMWPQLPSRPPATPNRRAIYVRVAYVMYAYVFVRWRGAYKVFFEPVSILLVAIA